MGDRDDLLDAVLDLQHDLAKYLRQPLAFLPKCASDDEVRAAIRAALVQTRRSTGGVRSARAIWEGALAEAPGLREVSGFEALENAVELVLGWEERLGASVPGMRAAFDADVASLAAALGRMRAALEKEGA